MDGKTWQTSTEAQAGKSPQREHEEVEEAGDECVCGGGGAK